MLYEKQKKLVHLVEQQIKKRVNNNTTLINVLGHIVEFRMAKVVYIYNIFKRLQKCFYYNWVKIARI